MPEILVEPGGRVIKAEKGVTLFEAIRAAGISLTSPCGGQGICRKCTIRLLSGRIDGEPVQKDTYLACRSRVICNCEIIIPSISGEGQLQILDDTRSGEFKLNPWIFRSGIIGEPADGQAAGIAVDLGTTTIVARLVSLGSGEILASTSTGNPQIKYGEDVISRISYGSTEPGLAELSKITTDCIGDLAVTLAEKETVPVEKILDIVVSGNSTMSHILLGISPSGLGVAPYEPPFRMHEPVLLRDAGLPGNASGVLRILPNIAGFVGGDTVSGILSTGIHKRDEVSIFIDIGTNGEIVIGNKDRLITTSAAAGPAFEGGRIECGMRAKTGAIDHVRITDDVTFTTIGEVPVPEGVCGTGVLEAVSEMLSAGVITGQGRLDVKDGHRKLAGNLAGRLDGSGGCAKFVLWSDGESSVYVTQKDIAEIQLAKSAIRSSVEILLHEYGIGIDDVHEVLIAGAFGHYINIEDIFNIGLLPRIDINRVRIVGNTSIRGAMSLIRDSVAGEEADEIAGKAEFIEIAGRPEFQELFIEHIPFPV